MDDIIILSDSTDIIHISERQENELDIAKISDSDIAGKIDYFGKEFFFLIFKL